MLDNLGKTDIYLLDQVMKQRITKKMRIFDAGCGWGRNSEIFIKNDFKIFGIDKSPEAIAELHKRFFSWMDIKAKKRFKVGGLEKIAAPDAHFDFIISSAVLHFSKDRKHFIQQFNELARILASGGILWIRMTAKHTIEPFATHLHDDVYILPDGSTRYLLDKNILKKLMRKHDLTYLDPFKTVNVNDIRTMATIVLQKK